MSWDGITLRNGATVLPIICVFTDHSGKIASEILDVPISQGSTGAVVANTVVKVLDTVIGIRERRLSLLSLGFQCMVAVVCHHRRLLADLAIGLMF